ncbi:general transcription factor 3C polypeptide 5 [Agrilus planipennis]|uniref:General transcription factor 3C polypeptide 5 n=1 Tax=Agrilus planipennis TaxID=224129 RepID=A0A1W4XK46_AGRPL|nr:general transcription factor 3C polypeptide 5 [Agrilus planipennis]
MFKLKIVDDNTNPNKEGGSTVHEHFHDFSRKLMCIEYPGIVNNVDKMLETLGGLNTLEMEVGTRKKYIELKFRPDDMYSKSCYGDKEKKPGILVKIKIRQPKVNLTSQELKENCAPIYEYDVVGVTAMTVKFKRMCDFQYLPLIPKDEKESSSSQLINIHNSIFPKTLPSLSYLMSDDAKNLPLFFPPGVFSRHSRPIDIRYDRSEVFKKSSRPEIANRYLPKRKNALEEEGKHIVTNTRKSRTTHTVFMKFEDQSCPSKPPPLEMCPIVKIDLSDELEKIKQLFSDRPIWSKTGIQHHTQISSTRLKHLISHVAYHMVTGPWRIMWVRFGCDPRKDPNMRIYQTFDYRIRAVAGLKARVSARATPKAYGFHGDLTNIKKFRLEDHLFDDNKTAEVPTENHYILRPGVIPAFRQTLYQYCDLQLPEIQLMFEKLPKVPPDAKCHPKNGWLPENFTNQCREIVNQYVLEAVDSTSPLQDQADINNDLRETEDDMDEEEGRLYDSDSSGEENENNDYQSDEIIDEEEIRDMESFLEDIIKDSY